MLYFKGMPVDEDSYCKCINSSAISSERRRTVIGMFAVTVVNHLKADFIITTIMMAKIMMT